MYRAGFIVSADDCDYESSKELGLICPFCSEAVFLKSGYLRGVSTFVSAAFCHYHTDDPMADDCELRAQRPDGQKYIEQLQIESKNQRLKLFNKKLVDLAIEPPRRKNVKFMKKALGGKWCESTSIQCRKLFQKDKDNIQKRMVIGFESLLKGKTEPVFDRIAESQIPGSRQSTLQEFSQIDKKLHLAVCAEVVDFLGTRTAGYAFEKLFISAVTEITIAAHYQMFGCAPKDISLPSAIAKVKEFELSALADFVGHVVFNVKWVHRLQGELNP